MSSHENRGYDLNLFFILDVINSYTVIKMKIIVKTLKGEKINLEVSAEDDIESIKAKIKEIKGFQIESQKIMFKGKPTNNTSSMTHLGVNDGDFLVLMTLIKKSELPKKQQTVDDEKKPKSKPPKQQVLEKKQQKQEQKKQTIAEEAKINELTNMGFSKEQSIQALSAASNDFQTAVEFLINGIPTIPPQNQQSGEINRLLHDPNLSSIRQQIRNNPASLEAILQTLSEHSPELYNLIEENPDQIENLIFGGAEGEESDQEEIEEIAVNMSGADQQAINRLMSLGFSKIDAAQVYLACDKNEQLAANMLFDRLAKGDLEEQQMDGDYEEDQNGPFYD